MTYNEEQIKNLVLVATGDSLITRRLSTYKEEDFLAAIALIKGADVAFTNLETTIHDFKGYPAAQGGGSWMVSPPLVAEELRLAGFNLLSRANNHAMDWAVEGMFATSEFLDKACLTHAGVGKDLAEARKPAYLDTEKGRVALISASSTFAPWGRAGNARRDSQGRPGLNPLRYEATCYVTKDIFDILDRMGRELSVGPSDGPQTPNEMHLLGMKFAMAEKCRIGTATLKLDMEGNIRSVREAYRQADWVIVSLHTHEADQDAHSPAQFAVTFAKACIDNGADAVIMHGPHVLRGIEIYKDKPIFYSLSNFIYQSKSLEKLPEDVYERYGLGSEATPSDVFDLMDQTYYRSPESQGEAGAPHVTGTTYSVLAVAKFENRKIHTLKLYPVTLGAERHRIHCGYPRLARGDRAKRIIDIVARLSGPFGTRIEYADGIGIVRCGN